MKLDNFFEMSYFINLDERQDRLKDLDKEWYKIGFYPEKFSAIKCENGAIGCYLSHLEILRRAQKSNSNVLIFEDDVYFSGDYNYKYIVEESLEELYDLDFDMGYLGGNILRPFFQTTKHWARLSHCQSTHAMFFNRKFLPTVVNFLEQNPPQKNGLCLDQLYADYLVPNCRAYMIIPMIAIQKSDFSSIERKDMTYDIPIQRYNHFLVRNEKL